MKRTLKFIIILVIMIAILGIGNKVEAASVSLDVNKEEVNVGDTITITATVTAAQWDLKIILNGETLTASEELDNYASNITRQLTATYKATQAGQLTFYLKGDATDFSQEVKSVNESITVDVKEVITPQPKPEPEPEQPTTPDTKPEPETPIVEEKPNFTETNKKMYASKDNMNLRATWSTESEATRVDKGTELTVTATSSNKVNGYVWYRVSYNGKTLYVASNLLTDTKPEEKEEPTEEPIEEEPKEETPIEEPTTVDEKDEDIEVKDGLKSLEIEGLTLTPAFSPDIYEYRVIVKKDLSELMINAVPATEGATITIAGNGNLQEGENLITIVVYNSKNEVEATYQITTNKNTLDLTDIDDLLKSGTLLAKKETTIYIAIFVVSLVGLIVVMALRSRIRNNEEDYEEESNEQEFTENEQTVENASEEIVQEEKSQAEIVQEEEVQEETPRPRREKRKGKHF